MDRAGFTASAVTFAAGFGAAITLRSALLRSVLGFAARGETGGAAGAELGCVADADVVGVDISVVDVVGPLEACVGADGVADWAVGD